MLTKYGVNNIIVLFAISAILAAAALISRSEVVQIVCSILAATLFALTFIFFRDPKRVVPDEIKNDQAIVLSPTDGTVMSVEEREEPVYRKEKSTRIAIFLSLFDAHVNRVPVGGEVEFLEGAGSKYVAAFVEDSANKNVQNIIGIKSPRGKVLFRQMVGLVARRLVCELKIGDKVEIGDKFGMMKFGSRMDVYVDTSAEISVKKGDRVVAGKTILAKMK